jgi:hypothetical protein
METRNLGIDRRFRYNGYGRSIDEMFGVVASVGPPEHLKEC